MSMSSAEIDAFLMREHPAHLGVLGTIDSKGFPNLVPVWYRWDGEAAYIWTTMERAWPKHLLRETKVSLSVQEVEPPFAAVLLKGYASLETDGDGLWDEVRRICARYIEASELEAYIAPWDSLRTMVTVRPERVVSWARGY